MDNYELRAARELVRDKEYAAAIELLTKIINAQVPAPLPPKQETPWYAKQQ